MVLLLNEVILHGIETILFKAKMTSSYNVNI